MLEELEHFLARRLPGDGPVIDAHRRRCVGGTEPFIAKQHHRLGQVERGELSRRDRHDSGRKRDLVIVEARALIAEQQAAANALAPRRAQLARRFRRRHDRLGDAALAGRGGEHQLQIAQRLGHIVVKPHRVEQVGSASRHMDGLLVRPAVARRDETQVGQAEILHRPRRRADILAQLGPGQDDGGGGHLWL